MRAVRLALAARHLQLRSTATVASAAATSPSTRRYVTTGSSNVASRSIAKLLEWKPREEVRDVVVNGFIRSVRSMKSRSFVALGDGSCLASLQALVPTNQAQGCGLLLPPTLSRAATLHANASSLRSLTLGAAICLTGSWVPSKGTGQSHELHVDNVQVLGPSDPKVHCLPTSPLSAGLLSLWQA